MLSRKYQALTPQSAATPQLSLLETEHPVVEQLRDLNPDDLSARQALELLYQLKQQL